jgi:hypothetical protein
LGSKHHLLTDANGIPLSVILTGANRHDVTQLLRLVGRSGVRDTARRRFKATGPTTRSGIARNSRLVTSNRSWPNETLNMGAGWVCTDG